MPRFRPPSVAPSRPALTIGPHLWRSLAFSYPGSLSTRYLRSRFGRKSCFPVVLSHTHLAFGPAGGIRSFKPSAACFRLCALALVSAADFLLPLLPLDVSKFRRFLLACVHRIVYAAFPTGATPARTDVGTHHRGFLRDYALSHRATSLSLHSTSHTPTQRRLTVRNAWSSDLHAPHRNLLATEGPHRARPKLCIERRGQSA